MTQPTFLFDKFNQYEIPNFSLANPNGNVLYNLGQITDRQLKLRLNALSELSFNAVSYIDGQPVDYYNFLDYRRLVFVDGIGHFMITGLETDNDGVMETKKVTCLSQEVELNFKKISLFSGTFQFWDTLSENQPKTLMGKIMEYLPSWSISHIDTELNVLFRTFDISDSTIYNFLMNDVSQAYQCIFAFDTINKTISAYSSTSITTPTDIFLSYGNLVQKTNIKPITDELETSLSVCGGGGLSILTVNPLGTDNIYNFDYYKNTNWMSASLITAIDNWKIIVSGSQAAYANLLTVIIATNNTLVTQQSELVTLEGTLAAAQEVLTAQIRAGLPTTTANNAVRAAQSAVDNQKTLILTTQAIITGLNAQLSVINTALSFETNFTPIEIQELSNFIIGSTYTNESFVVVNSAEAPASASAIQLESQHLYDQAQLILAKVSEPRYTFEVESVNFVFLKEFQTFIDQLVLGAVVTIMIQDEKVTGSAIYTYPALLGIDYSYDNPEEFKLTFSNRLRLDDAAFQFSDLFNQSINSGITTSFNSPQWGDWSKNSKDTVTTFINSDLDASKNALVNASNQNFIIDSNGLRGRYASASAIAATSGSGAYEDDQIWIINNLIGFTDDGWNHSRLAIGRIQSGNGQSFFGVCGDALVGRIIAGNQLTIENEQLTFAVSGSSVTIKNGDLQLYGQNDRSRIFLNPNTGIEISKLNQTSGSYSPNFWTDTDGNVHFSGNLDAASGYFSGSITAKVGQIGAWYIDELGMNDGSYGDYIHGNGQIKLGKLTIDGSEATFDGNIYARNLQDYVDGKQIKNIIADTITTGSLRGINIYGENIYWPGVRMWSPQHGNSTLECSNTLVLNSGAGQLILGPKYSILDNPTLVRIGGAGFTAPPQISILGQIVTMDYNYTSGWAKTETIDIGGRELTFVNGLLCDPDHYQQSGSGVVVPPKTWTTTGLSGSDVRSVAVDPANQNIVYAGTYGGGVLKSIDNGNTWNSTGSLGDLYGMYLAVDPTSSNTIYAGTIYAAVRKSTDGGNSWSAAGGMYGDDEIRALIIDSTNPLILYVIAAPGIGYSTSHLYKSTDGGNNWVIKDSQRYTYNSLVLDSTNHNTLYVGTVDVGVLKTTDGGETWASVGADTSGVYVASLAIDSSAGILYMGAGASMAGRKSINGGSTWTNFSGAYYPYDFSKPLAVDSSTHIVYSQGTLLSSNYGSSWQIISTPSGFPTTAYNFAFSSSYIYLSTPNGLYKTNQ